MFPLAVEAAMVETTGVMHRVIDRCSAILTPSGQIVPITLIFGREARDGLFLQCTKFHQNWSKS